MEFLRGHSALTRELDARLREQHGLSLKEFDVLVQLLLAGEQRLRRVDLADRLLITQGGITRLLAGLEDRGLVCRGAPATDRRVVHTELTDSGRELAEAARRDHLAAVAALFADRFSGEELDRLAELLGRLSSPRSSEA